MQSGQIVFTNRARCRDCYRCLRGCPVKAIRMQNDQAYVVWEQCIACGTCIRECPQQAKNYRNDIEKSRQLLATHSMVAVSLAPSFAALFNEWEQKRLPSALRQLGFKYVSETSIGAYEVANQTGKCIHDQPALSHICSACPALVTYVERYEPDLSNRLVNVASPMIAHARQLKNKLGPECRVVFIGPCVAKKAEAEWPGYEGLVECALTFQELKEWLDQAGIEIAKCEESGFDDEPEGQARYFPLPGGLARTASLSTDLLDLNILAVSGISQIREALEGVHNSHLPVVLEPLFCEGGCMNGPGIIPETNWFSRRTGIIEYARKHPGLPPDVAGHPWALLDLKACLETGKPPAIKQFTEEEIRRELDRTGKSKPEDQLNCGACGYPSCRDKAIAVLRGMAEREMCIPYMRHLAERRTDKIIESSPNGIVILDERLNIISMNLAFKRYFMCSDAVLGKHISYLMDPEPFEKLALSGDSLLQLTVKHDRYNLLCHELLYPLREEEQYVGIFVNITQSRAQERELEMLRSETVAKAKELLDHQMKMAQIMAQHLGETAAQGEELVRKLMSLAEEKPAGNEKLNPWPMSTSK